MDIESKTTEKGVYKYRPYSFRLMTQRTSPRLHWSFQAHI